MKKDCDIMTEAMEAVQNSIAEEQSVNDKNINKSVYLKSKEKLEKAAKWWMDDERTVSKKKLDKYFGTLTDREAKAQKIYMILENWPDLAPTILDEFKHRLANVGAEYKNIIRVDDTGAQTVILENLPKPILNGFYRFAKEWVDANGKDWNSMYYQENRLTFGLPATLRFEENTGAYNEVFLATLRYADGQQKHIKAFNTGESIKGGAKTVIREGKKVTIPKLVEGMAQVLTDVKSIYHDIKRGPRDAWLEGGYHAGRTVRKGKANLITIFTEMMRGRIIYVSKATAETTYTIIDKETKEQELTYKHGGDKLYINTQWAPTGKQFDTGDAMFRWQKPVPFKYDQKIHGTITDMKIKDHRGRYRYDTYNLIKNSVPLTDTMIESLQNAAERARKIDNEFFHYSQENIKKSFDALLKAVMVHFPNKDIEQVKEVFLNHEFDDYWSDEEKATFVYLEENFTSFSLAAPFLSEGGTMQYKDNHYPFLFMPETFGIVLKEAISNIEIEIRQLEKFAKRQKGEDILVTEEKIDGLTTSLAHMKQLTEQLLTMPEDTQKSAQMVARVNSKYFKHITNAFDLLHTRTDENVYHNMLEHTALAIERNYLTAALITGLNKVDSPSVKHAMINLYKRTIGRKDTTASFLGVDISDANLPPKMVRGLRAYRKYLTLLLANPVTTSRNYAGHIEKFNKVGVDNAMAAFEYYAEFKDDPRLQDLISDMGVISFDEFFTHSIVKDLEENEIERSTIESVVAAFTKYYTSTKSEVDRLEDLQDTLKLQFGHAMNQGAFLSKKEVESFTKKMKADRLQRKVNKIVNFAIANEYKMGEAIKNKRTTIGSKDWTKKKLLSFVEKIVSGREMVKDWAVMTEAEKHLRITSAILGAWGAQKISIIGTGRLHELEGNDRLEAIKYGRRATNLQFDFGMSKQQVGELHGTTLGQSLGHLAVWKTQKGSSDIHLFKYAAKNMDSDIMPIAILQAMGVALNPIKYPASLLRQTNNDALMLRRWFKGQFLIEGLMQFIFLGGAILPHGIRQTLRAAGAHSLGAAGSDVAAWFWMPVMLLLNASLSDAGDSDEERIEQLFSYMLRKVPGVGLGVGLLYDIMAILVAFIAEEDQILEDKLIRASDLAVPIPAGRALKRAAVQLYKD